MTTPETKEPPEAPVAPHEGEVYCAVCMEAKPSVGVCPGCGGLYCPAHFLQGDHHCDTDRGIGE